MSEEVPPMSSTEFDMTVAPSAEQIRKREFATVRRGYDADQVRDYLRQVRYECPALLPSSMLAQVESAALEAYRQLSCRDVARIDYRLSEVGLYFLEANPLPGLNPQSSDLVIMAGLRGWSYERLIEAILSAALERHAIAATGALTI